VDESVAPISAASSQLASHLPNLRIPVDLCHHVTLGQALILTPFVTSIKEKVRLEMKVYKDSLIQSNKNLYGLLVSKETHLESNKDYELLFKNEAMTSWDTPIFLRLISDGQIYFLSMSNAFILGSPVPGVIKH
jgi:hypothetical protein